MSGMECCRRRKTFTQPERIEPRRHASGCSFKTAIYRIANTTTRVSLVRFVLSALAGSVHKPAFRSRRALAMTDTELKLIATPAMIGLNNKPKNG